MFTIKIETENAAFNEGLETETARILRTVAGKLESGLHSEGICMDFNGNKVGNWTLKED